MAFKNQNVGRRSTLLGATLIATTWTTITTAEPKGAAEKAAAEALFDTGKQLLQEGKLPEACSKLEQSHAIDPGVGTLLYLGECYERSERYASAWATFREAASAATASGQGDRSQTAAARAAHLEPLLSRLTVTVASENEAAQTQITLDGKALSSGLWGTAFPVDSGKHSLAASAPGHASWSGEVVIGARADSQTLHVPALVPIPAPEPAQESSPTPGAGAALEPAPASDVPPDVGDTQRLSGLIMGGVGLVAIGVGAGFGVDGMSKNDAANARCTLMGCTDEDAAAAKTLADSAEGSALAANVLYIAGGAVLLTGAVVYFAAPHWDDGAGDIAATRWRLTPLVGPTGAALSLKGQF